MYPKRRFINTYTISTLPWENNIIKVLLYLHVRRLSSGDGPSHILFNADDLRLPVAELNAAVKALDKAQRDVVRKEEKEARRRGYTSKKLDQHRQDVNHHGQNVLDAFHNISQVSHAWSILFN